VIRLTQTATTHFDRKTAFGHVGDFGNIDRWDPGVVTSTKATPGDVGVGTVYSLVLDYNGRNMEMDYAITQHDPGRRIVLEGSGSRVKAVDVIEFTEHDDGTLVTYVADLGLTGIARLFQPFMKDRFAKVGRDAGEGLRRWLGELEDAAKASG
jgi:carbon monoxide dehydrogenase subunit G